MCSDERLSTSLAVHGGADDASSKAGTFATGIETLHDWVAEGLSVARDANRRRGTCLGTYKQGFVGEEAVGTLAKELQSLLHTC